jgi:hypothetical protein
MDLHCSLASISDFPHLGELLSTRFPLEDVVVVVVVADVVVEVVVVAKRFSFVGLSVGTAVAVVVGKAVGWGVGRPDATGGAEELLPHPFPTLMATSAQFQNCSGTPRPSGGIL